MNASELRFRTIDLHHHADTAVAFRRDSYVCSFGSDEGFGTVDEYLEWLAERIARYPRGHVHVWRAGSIVGQLEMLTHPTTPVRGYVNLFYLRPEARGRGFGDALHDYAVDFMRSAGAQRARLRVSPNNRRAMAYYRKHAWQDLGPGPDEDGVHVMERAL